MMNSIRFQPWNGRKVMLPSSREEVQSRQGSQQSATAQGLRPRPLLYGLPCAKCRIYYTGDQRVCPLCQGTERVAPNAVSAVRTVHKEIPEYCQDEAALELERERFLREFRAQIYAQNENFLDRLRLKGGQPCR